MAINYLGRVGKAGARLVSSGLSSCKDLYNDLNAANLTGAVDVVVVKQQDGSVTSTPFHVRFGKLGVLRTGDLQKEVDIEVNGQAVDTKMMLDESGHAFFVRVKQASLDQVKNDVEPQDVDQTRLPQDSDETRPPHDVAETRPPHNVAETRPVPHPASDAVDIKSPSATREWPLAAPRVARSFTDDMTGDEDTDMFSDTELSHSLPAGIGSGGTHSDTEMELAVRRVQTKGQPTRGGSLTTASPPSGDRLGFWATLTAMLRKKKKISNVEDGIYLDDLDAVNLDPQEVNKFFPGPPNQSLSSGSTDMDQLVHQFSDVSLSTCGGPLEHISHESFSRHQLSFTSFSSDPASVLSNPDLVVRISSKYYTWSVAAPMIIAMLCYQQPLPEAVQSNLERDSARDSSPNNKSHLWQQQEHQLWRHREKQVVRACKSEGATPRSLSPQKWVGSESVSSDEEDSRVMVRGTRRSLRRKRFNLTNTPSSDELLSWPLRAGMNQLVFSITTKYQGTTKTACSLYLWSYNDKIVISDIDGTITRSDVAGQVLPWFGKDWTQNGVTELFNAITDNGYHIIYLSARAIGQSSYTKDFLRRVHKGRCFLPDGPLMLVPASMYTAFKKEVIDKNPEEFKIDCLRQIRSLFPPDHNPYHAGFGNKPSDAKSYCQVEVPSSRIYIVNYQGDLRNQLSCTFHSSYSGLQQWVDAQFTPITDQPDAPPTREEFSSFNYWRDTVQYEAIDLPDDL